MKNHINNAVSGYYSCDNAARVCTWYTEKVLGTSINNGRYYEWYAEPEREQDIWHKKL